MATALVFVLAPEEFLPADGASWRDLLHAQALGLRSGVTLRIFSTPPDQDASLETLISQGSADICGLNPLGPNPGRPLCDALVPHIDPRVLGLGVYALSDTPPGAAPSQTGNTLLSEPPIHSASGLLIRSIRCLDRFALRDAENETCWFYPTDPGRYLSWENRRRLRSEPGFLPEIPRHEDSMDYRRDDIHVLWSLMADDRALTCVGLTYARRRIEWPLLRSDAEECATWSSFRIDPMAEESYEEICSISVFGAEATP
jgi:hypothetical protein